VGAEMSLELVPGDGVDVRMSVAVRLSPVGCCPIELVCSEKDLLAISALGDHEFLLDPFEPIFCVQGSLACENVLGQVRRNSAKRDWCGGGGGGTCCWLGCMLLRVCSMACIS
jgi:hypothetical protein